MYVNFLVGVDVLVRFMHALPIRNKCAKTVATALEQRVFSNLPQMPNIIISDNGPKFRAQAFKQLLDKYSIAHYTTIPYLPQTNGRIERINQTLQRSLATACAQNHSSWGDELARVLILYNHSKHSQTGKVPSDFFTQEQARLPLPGDRQWTPGTNRFKPYKQGDLVGYKIPAYARKGKLSPRYQGPCKIQETDRHGLTYDIHCKGEEKIKKAHYSQLKPWHGQWRNDPKAKENNGDDISVRPPEPRIVSVEEQLQHGIDVAAILGGLRVS